MATYSGIGLLFVSSIAACGHAQSHDVPKVAGAPPGDAQTDSQSPPKLTKERNCMIPRHSSILIMDPYPVAPAGVQADSDKILKSVTAQLRTEAEISGLIVSVAVLPQMSGNDCGPAFRRFLLDGEVAPGVCFARVGLESDAEWVLAGLLRWKSSAYVLTLQLVESSNAENTRVVSVQLPSPEQSSENVHSAWEDLTSPIRR
jgi:hypothetical protein